MDNVDVNEVATESNTVIEFVSEHDPQGRHLGENATSVRIENSSYDAELEDGTTMYMSSAKVETPDAEHMVDGEIAKMAVVYYIAPVHVVHDLCCNCSQNGASDANDAAEDADGGQEDQEDQEDVADADDSDENNDAENDDADSLPPPKMAARIVTARAWDKHGENVSYTPQFELNAQDDVLSAVKRMAKDVNAQVYSYNCGVYARYALGHVPSDVDTTSED